MHMLLGDVSFLDPDGVALAPAMREDTSSASAFCKQGWGREGWREGGGCMRIGDEG